MVFLFLFDIFGSFDFFISLVFCVLIFLCFFPYFDVFDVFPENLLHIQKNCKSSESGVCVFFCCIFPIVLFFCLFFFCVLIFFIFVFVHFHVLEFIRYQAWRLGRLNLQKYLKSSVPFLFFFFFFIFLRGTSSSREDSWARRLSCRGCAVVRGL